MGLLKPMLSSAGYLKAGIMGFSGSGKTFTASELAIGVRKYFKLEGPVAMFDTEGGADYIRAKIQAATSQPLMGHKSRSFDDLMTMSAECVAEKVSVLIVDSLTHIWRELCDSYLAEINDVRQRRYGDKAKPQEELQFQDWGPIKSRWSKWTDFFLNSPLSIIICGRAGFEYDHETNSRGKKELVKTGVKMKAESEFGFEPSLLIEMERDMNLETREVVRRATILKDRFDCIDGKTCQNPTFGFFEPHVSQLNPAGHTTIDVAAKSQLGVGGPQEAARQRSVLLFEIKGELLKRHPGQSPADKEAKAILLLRHFDARTWQAVGVLSDETLVHGLAGLKAEPLPESAASPDDGSDVEYDDLERELQSLRDGFDRVLGDPSRLPRLKDRVSRLPEGEEKATLLAFAVRAEQSIIEAAKNQPLDAAP